MGIIQAIVNIVSNAGAIAGIAGGTTSLSLMGTAVVTTAIYGGNALSKSLASKRESPSNSPTYQFSALQTQTNNQLPIPLIYGENKVAGNRLWQQYRSGNTIIDRIVAFGEGPVDSISDIRLNDLPISQVSGVSYRLYTGLPGQNVDTIVPGDLTKRLNTVGSLKNLCYIALSVTANEKIRGDYNMTAIVKGRKVRIYSTPDTYSVDYSNNPAWCLLDFLTCYNGCGIGLSATGERDDEKIKELIDLNSFIEAASFCDEPIDLPGEEGKTLPRFSFNMIIDSQSQRREIIEEFKKACRGVLTVKGKQLQLKIDMPQSTVKTISSNDIIAGTEQFYSLPKEENYDRIVIKYRSKAQEWAICEAIAEKPVFDSIPPIEHSVNIYSVTEHNQASRLAWYYLNKVGKERAFGYFETDYRAFDLEIGDLIEFSDNLMNYSAKPVKVTKVIDKNDGTFGVSWREYDEAVYSDNLGSIEPVFTLCALNDNYITPPDVEGFYATIMVSAINLLWTSFSDTSITYEIRMGETWENSSLVASNVGSNTLFVPISSTGLKKFMIKAKSRYNFYSKTESVAVLYVENIPTVNTILNENLLEAKNGLLIGAKAYNSVIKHKASGFWQKLMPKEPQTPFSDSNNKWSEICTTSESSFTTAIYDIKDRFTSLLTLTSQFIKTSDSQNLSVQITTSIDGLGWCDWEIFNNGSYDFRYYRMKFIVQNPENKPWALTKAYLSIDVPDRDEIYKNILVSNQQTGVTITFATHEQSKIKKDFLTTPSIVANITGSYVGYCVITQKSPQSLTVKTFSDNNTPIAATCDIHVKGY